MLKTTLFLVSCFLFYSCDTPKQSVDSSNVSDSVVHKKVIIYDTIHVKVTIHDTVHVKVFDTIHITKTDTTFKHVTVYDTSRIYIKDTIRTVVNDTTHKAVTIFDTSHKQVIIYDTTHTQIIKYDTTHKAITIFDTSHVQVFRYDTTINHTTIYDTTRLSITIFDTTRNKVNIFDTTHIPVIIHDTTKIPFNDTVYKAVTASAFDGRNNPYGIGLTTGTVTQKAIDQFGGLLKQVRARFSFSDFDKGIGKQYSYSLLDSAVNLCVTNHLGLMFQVIRSPYDNMPTYLWSAPYSVPIVFTDDPRPTLNRFPYYLNDSFNSRFDAFGVDLARHVFNYKNNQQAALKFCMNSPLSTGDYVAYKGNIIKVTINNIVQSNPQDYALNETQTTTYVHVTLNQLITAFKQNTFLKIAANPDNTARDWDYDISQGITSLKVGELGHTIWNSGEGTIITRLRSLLKLFSDAFFFSENEGTTSSPAWTQQEVLPLCMQGIAAGMKSISFANANVSSDSAYYIFNEYAGDTASGIIYCKDIVDFNDTSRFNPLVFADIIDPLKVSNYNKQVQRINNDPTIPNAQKQEQLSTLLVNNFNQQRIKNIEVVMIPQGYQFVGDSQYHRMDGGIDLYNHGFNYESRLHMSNFSGKGVFRLGDSTWVFGRACLQIDNADIDYESDTIKELSITYFDSDKEIDVFFCNKRFGVIKITIAPTNTKRFMTKIFSLYNYVSRGVSGHDLHIAGSGIVQLIEVH